MANIEDVVLIKINRSYKENMTAEDLYQATSFSWVASFGKTATRDIKYYCAVYQNKIIEVYDFLGYEEEIPKRNPSRYVLSGEVTSGELRSKLVGLDVSDLHKGSGNPIKYTSIERLLNQDEEAVEIPEEDPIQAFDEITNSDLLAHIHTYIESRGFYYSKEDLYNFYLSLRSKPFVIISGISGTGKTKIVELFANSVGATEDNGQFKMIPVRPDWSDSSDLLGYLTLQGEYKKGPLAELIEHAMNYPDLPHFALLDEMNLARVEYYFSDVLSVMESRKKDVDEGIVSSYLVDPNLYQKEAFGESPGGPLRVTNNLYIVGTVNMDETTHPFSKKVLDRANTIEFNRIELNHFDFLTGVTEKEPEKRISNSSLEASYIHLIDVFSKHRSLIEKISKDIENINVFLSKINAQVGYRVRDEICFYMVHNKETGLLTEDEAMDFCYMQKILPRISGGQVVEDVLIGLEKLWTKQTAVGQEQSYPKSYLKVEEMLGRLRKNGFTSFWIA
ncbi:McrB family protein [Paenisporosarcina sp. NPDC076898]|uniref:McrB family protein n=1 Tax=unclassified Paenisporosarcina TaxID=2642018 RepID=UPI003CFCEE38